MESQCASVLLEVGPGGTVCQAHYQNCNLLERKQEFSINYVIWTTSVGTEAILISSGTGGNLLKPKFPDASQRPAMAAGLPDESGLGPAVVHLFCFRKRVS